MQITMFVLLHNYCTLKTVWLKHCSIAMICLGVTTDSLVTELP